LQASPLEQLANMIGSKQTPRMVKIMLVKQATDILAEATKGYVPCKEGCSHCCKMATNITVEEAQAIAIASGRDMVTPAVMNDDKGNAVKYLGVPCPFLIDNRCSIYHVRPFACRVHYAVDRDNLLCEIIPPHPIKQLMINVEQFNMMNLLAVGLDNFHFADIRQFFPSKD
jgi:Fe-S-cluster containining protein